MTKNNLVRLPFEEINRILLPLHNPLEGEYQPFSGEVEDVSFRLMLYYFSTGTGTPCGITQHRTYVPSDYQSSTSIPTQVIPGIQANQYIHEDTTSQQSADSLPSQNLPIAKAMATILLIVSVFGGGSFLIARGSNQDKPVTQTTNLTNPQSTDPTKAPKIEKLTEEKDPVIRASKPKVTNPEPSQTYTEPAREPERRANSRPIPVQPYEGKSPEDEARINRQIFKKKLVPNPSPVATPNQPASQPVVKPSSPPTVVVPTEPVPVNPSPTVQPQPVLTPNEPVVVPTQQAPKVSNPSADKLSQTPGNVVDLGGK